MPLQPKNADKINTSFALDKDLYEFYKLSDMSEIISPSELFNIALGVTLGLNSPKEEYCRMWIEAANRIKTKLKEEYANRINNKANDDKEEYDTPLFKYAKKYIKETSLKENKILTTERCVKAINKYAQYELGQKSYSADTKMLRFIESVQKELLNDFSHLEK